MVPYKYLFPRCVAAIHHGGRWEEGKSFLFCDSFWYKLEVQNTTKLIYMFALRCSISNQWIYCSSTTTCRNPSGWFLNTLLLYVQFSSNIFLVLLRNLWVQRQPFIPNLCNWSTYIIQQAHAFFMVIGILLPI